MSEGFIVYSPYPSMDEAKNAARQAVENKLSFCVNIFNCTSIYAFKGKDEDHPEFVCFFKTLGSRLEELRRFIKKSHPYKVPAIITLKMSDMNTKYLDWAIAELKC